MGRLTFVALVLGVIFTLSYATGAHIVVRYLNPPFGAWWNSTSLRSSSAPPPRSEC